jgi:hypothetical protein
LFRLAADLAVNPPAALRESKLWYRYVTNFHDMLFSGIRQEPDVGQPLPGKIGQVFPFGQKLPFGYQKIFYNTLKTL